MILRPFEFIIQAIASEHDGDGEPVGKLVADPVSVFGVKGLHDFADAFEAKLAEYAASKEQGET